MNKIVFYQERTFGDKFNVTFEFIKQNWKLMLRYFAYVVLPLSFVAEFFMEAMMKNVMTLATDPEELMNLIPSYGGFFLVSIAVYLWMGAVSFSLLQVYNARPDGLQNIVFADFKPLLGRNAWRLVKSGLALSLVLLVVMILAGCLFALQMPVIAAVVLSCLHGINDSVCTLCAGLHLRGYSPLAGFCPKLSSGLAYFGWHLSPGHCVDDSYGYHLVCLHFAMGNLLSVEILFCCKSGKCRFCFQWCAFHAVTVSAGCPDDACPLPVVGHILCQHQLSL